MKLFQLICLVLGLTAIPFSSAYPAPKKDSKNEKSIPLADTIKPRNELYDSTHSLTIAGSSYSISELRQMAGQTLAHGYEINLEDESPIPMRTAYEANLNYHVLKAALVQVKFPKELEDLKILFTDAEGALKNAVSSHKFIQALRVEMAFRADAREAFHKIDLLEQAPKKPLKVSEQEKLKALHSSLEKMSQDPNVPEDLVDEAKVYSAKLEKFIGEAPVDKIDQLASKVEAALTSGFRNLFSKSKKLDPSSVADRSVRPNSGAGVSQGSEASGVAASSSALSAGN